MDRNTDVSAQLEQIVEQYSDKCVQGQAPPLGDYCERYPELADQLRMVLPAIRALHAANPESNELQPVHSTSSRPRPESIGDYQILREIGRGGMGVVYEAEQRSLGRRVALKVLPQQFAGNRVTRERFLREARAAARLHHTNIVPVFEVGCDDGIVFYAMQYIPGQSLDEVCRQLRHLQESGSGGVDNDRQQAQPNVVMHNVSLALADDNFVRGPSLGSATEATDRERSSEVTAESVSEDLAETIVPADVGDSGVADHSRHPTFGSVPPQSLAATDPGLRDDTRSHAFSEDDGSSVILRKRAYYVRIARLGQQIAEALTFAHERGTIHRDIKPSNLILDPNGIVWVADFGLAKTDDAALTRTGDMLGTLRYMSPERFQGRCDERGDIYGLGVTLYELATLRDAFVTSDRLKLIELIANQEPIRPRVVAPEIPRDLETIILKAMSKEPADRYRSAAEFADDLRSFVEDEPIKARRATLQERFMRWARRNKAVAAALVGIAVLLVMVTMGSLLAAGKFRTLAEEQKQLVVQRNETILVVKEQRQAAQRQTSNLEFNRARMLCERRQVVSAMHWMLQSLIDSPEGDVDWQNMIRANLGMWVHHGPGLAGMLPVLENEHQQFQGCLLEPDGEVLLVATREQQRIFIVRYSMRTGQRLSSFAFDNSVLTSASDVQPARLDLTPDGQTLLVAISRNIEGELHAFEYPSFRPLGPPLALRHARRAFAISPDSSTCIIADSSGVAQVFSIRPFKELPPLPYNLVEVGASGITGLQFLDDRRLVTSSGISGGLEPAKTGSLRILDLETGSVERLLYTGGVTSFSISPDGTNIAMAANDYVWHLFDPRPNGRETIRYPMKGTTHTQRFMADMSCVMWNTSSDAMGFMEPRSGEALWQPLTDMFRHSADSNATFVASGTQKGWINVWKLPNSDIVAGSAPQYRSGSNGVGDFWGRHQLNYPVYHEGTGRVALTVRRSDVQLIDSRTGVRIGRPLNHPLGNVAARAFSPAGDVLVTCCHSQSEYISAFMRFWDAATGMPLSPWLPQENWVRAVSFSPDGRYVAVGDFRHQLRFLDTETFQTVSGPYRMPGIPLQLDFLKGGKQVAVAVDTDKVRVFDVDDQMQLDLKNAVDVKGMTIAYHDARNLIATAANDNTVRIVDLQGTPEIIQQVEADSVVPCFASAFSPSGKELLLGLSDGGLQLIEVATGKSLAGNWFEVDSSLSCVAFNSDGSQIAAGYANGKVQLIDRATFCPIGPEFHQRSCLQLLKFCDDDRRVFAASNKSVRFWPIAAPIRGSVDEIRRRLQLHTGQYLDESGVMQLVRPVDWTKLRQEVFGSNGAAAEFVPAFVPSNSKTEWHEACVFRAETSANPSSALWHLDRLQRLAPDDRTIALRSAHQHVLLHEYDQALEILNHHSIVAAERELSTEREDLIAWYHQQAAAAGGDFDWETCRWYLDRMEELAPEDAALHLLRAVAAHRLRLPDERDASLQKAVDCGLDPVLLISWAGMTAEDKDWSRTAEVLSSMRHLDSNLTRYFAEHCVLPYWIDELADQGKWDAVNQLLLVIGAEDPAMVHARYSRALVLKQLPDAAAALELSQQIVAECRNVLNSMNLENAEMPANARQRAVAVANGWLWWGAMCASENRAAADKLATQADAVLRLLEDADTSAEFRYALSNTLGLVYYRAGRFAEAEAMIQKGIEANQGRAGVTDEIMQLLILFHSPVPPDSEQLNRVLEMPLPTREGGWVESLEVRTLQDELRQMARERAVPNSR
jgi:serine/threonine protein kinase/WD40 repeat protein